MASEMRIRKAFADEDIEGSAAAHDARLIESAEETHASTATGEFIKSLVFGGIDGICTTFAIVAAVAGAGLSTNTVILMGVANLIADGLAMGLGDYLSEIAELGFVKHEFKREKWEYENYPEGEYREMVDLYVEKKGFTREDAETVMGVLIKYPKAFVETMCVDELGFIAPDDVEDFPAWKKGLITMIAFDVFGSVPLLVYVFAKALPKAPTPEALFVVSAIATALTLFLLGFVKASFTKQNKFSSGSMMLMNGSLAAGAAYGVGAILNKFLDLKQ
ncbi:Ccc1 family [Pelagophyceae sp. CCMP2097]|nr:Ccc1 family [Pelagophyceae sp. CCMP2097]